MVFLSTERMRIGGTEGAWHLLFGEWADALEGVVNLEFTVCPRCRRVEMKIPAGSRPEDSQLFTDTRSDGEPSLEGDEKAWNPLLGPPPDGDR
jgi:hypothetical protein